MSSEPPIDFAAIRRQAEAAGEEFLNQRWDSYLEKVRQVEALPENQSGADKSWVDEASEQYREHYRCAVRIHAERE